MIPYVCKVICKHLLFKRVVPRCRRQCLFYTLIESRARRRSQVFSYTRVHVSVVIPRLVAHASCIRLLSSWIRSIKVLTYYLQCVHERPAEKPLIGAEPCLKRTCQPGSNGRSFVEHAAGGARIFVCLREFSPRAERSDKLQNEDIRQHRVWIRVRNHMRGRRNCVNPEVDSTAASPRKALWTSKELHLSASLH